MSNTSDANGAAEARREHVCAICAKRKPEDEGGWNSTGVSGGTIDNPTYLWICNTCLVGFVCP